MTTRSQFPATIWLRVRDIARLTNLSRRYWQRRFARGHVPGSRQVRLGDRRLFLVDQSCFEPWWAKQLRMIDRGETQLTHPASTPEGTKVGGRAERTDGDKRARGDDRPASRGGRRRRRLSDPPTDARQTVFAFDAERLEE
jgi:hypothetical protein